VFTRYVRVFVEKLVQINELTLIKHGDTAYIDSREVAEIIGKSHKNLIRDIRGYIETMRQFGKLKIEPTDFFVEATYRTWQNVEQPCYLITKLGAEVVSNKLTGEKGVMFTVLYVKKFNEMAEREREREIAEIKAQSATTRLKVFNNAVRNVLSGYAQVCASEEDVMGFLRDAYQPFGITVTEDNDCGTAITATEIARFLGVYSETNRPHAHAVSAIIEKLRISPEHIEVVPFGLVGFSIRYENAVMYAVNEWLKRNNFPNDIPHLDFDYHVVYKRHPLFS